MSPYILCVQDERAPTLAEEHKSRTTYTSPTKVAIKNAPKVLSRDGAGGSKAEGSTGAAVGGADMAASCVLAASMLDDDAVICRAVLYSAMRALESSRAHGTGCREMATEYRRMSGFHLTGDTSACLPHCTIRFCRWRPEGDSLGSQVSGIRGRRVVCRRE